MESEKYQNRNSNHINRKRIKIISQTANEIIADIERADEVMGGQNGTPINASVFLDLLNTITSSSGTTITINEEPQALLSLENIFLSIYPVGSIYLSANSVNPSTLFGGTWTAWGEGRVPVGIGNNGETNYQTPEMTGGSENSVASHNHSASINNSALTTNSTAGGFQIAASGNGKALTSNHTGFVSFTAVSGGNSTTPNTYSRDDASKSNRSELTLDHSHTIESHSHTATITQTGTTGGNRQPFITCYMWKRIS